jgi:hypothetical protein
VGVFTQTVRQTKRKRNYGEIEWIAHDDGDEDMEVVGEEKARA